MATTIKYIWTDADNLIQIAASKTPPAPCAGYPQCNTGTPHRCYVTPYGLLPDEAHAPGDEVTIDLTHSRESWRATRFHLDSAWRPSQAAASTPSDGSWEKIDIPDAVTNLKGLCAHLQKTNPDLYPAAFYANEGAACRMLFDYWENGRYRNAVLKADPQIWTKYDHDPGSIPVKQGDAALTHVVHYVHLASAASAAPGAPMQLTLDSLDQRIEDFIAELDRQSSRVEEMMALSHRVLKDRYELLRALYAVHEIGRVVPADGGSTGPALAEAIGAWDDEGSLIARFREFLMGLAVAHGNWSQALLAQAPWWRTSDYTINAKEDAMAAASRLNDLLLNESNMALVADLREWAGQVALAMAADKLISGGDATPQSLIPPGVRVDGVTPVRPRLADQLDRLTLATARAYTAMGQMGVGPGADTLLAHYDAAPSAPAKGPWEIKGNNACDVFFALLGRATPVIGASFGNLAGPPSLAVAFLGWYAGYDFVSLAKKVQNAGPNSSVKALIAERKSKLLTRFLTAFDGIVTEEELERAVLLDAKSEDRRLFISKLRKSRLSNAQRSGAFNSVALILQLFATYGAYESAKSSDEPLAVLNWLGVGASGGASFVGAVDAALDARLSFFSMCKDAATLEKASTVLGKVGMCFGLLSGVVGVATGVYNLFFDPKRVDKSTASRWADGFGIGGSAASVGVCGLMMAGAADSGWLLPLEIAVVACLVLSGYLSWDDLGGVSEPSAAATQILAKVTNHQLWQAFVVTGPTATDLTTHLEKLCKGPLPQIPSTDQAAKDALLNVGLSAQAVLSMMADTTKSASGGSSGSGTESAYQPSVGDGGAGGGR